VQVTANNIQIEVQISGPENGPVILLNRGLGSQLTTWPEAFCEGLAGDGYRVIRFDNRDCGLSQKMGRCETDNVIPEPSYNLYDMAADTVGVLDALKIERAHILGCSMGGMIVQIVAAKFPERVISLTSIMSSGGEADPTRSGTPEVSGGLTALWPASSDREAIIAKFMSEYFLYGTRTYRLSKAEVLPFVIKDMERCYCPGGYLRQYAALKSLVDRQDELKSIICPALIIHGDEDFLLPVSCGERAAELIPGATFKLIKGMGHDMPGPVLAEINAYVHAHCQRAGN